MSRITKSWVVATLTTIFAMMLSLMVSISPAAASDFVPNSPVVNDPAGISQDWFKVQGDSQTYSYYWDAEGNNGIPEGAEIATNGALSVTVYARHYMGDVQMMPMTFTNAAGASAPNTVTFTNARCNGTGGTFFDVYWNQVYDGSGLVSYLPIVVAKSDSGQTNLYSVSEDIVVRDGEVFRYDPTVPGGVWLSPGWHTVYAGEYHDRSGAGGTFYHASSSNRLWVPACGNVQPPAGQVPPGGTQPDPDPGTDTPPGTEPGGTTGAATGKLKLLQRKSIVKAVAVNRKVSSLTTFKLKAPGRKKPVVIKALAGQVVVKKVKALAPGTYVLKARVKINGKFRFVRVARLVVKR